MFGLRPWWSGQARPLPASPAHPLVSCIMPTRDRRALVGQALRYFQRQDYPAKELIVVDDGQDNVRDVVAATAETRYLRVAAHTSIGQKRQIAIAASSGTIIAHWDDDDWYDARRLSYQIAPLLSGEADITALRMSFLYDVLADRVWFVDRAIHTEMFFLGIHTGSIVYWKQFGVPAAAFPAIDLGEDVAFLRRSVGRGARVLRLPNDALFASLVATTGALDATAELPFLEEVARRSGGVVYPARRAVCVYVRHATNTWRFVCGQHLDPGAWHPLAPAEVLPPHDLRRYRAIAAGAGRSRSPGTTPSAERPL
jgi:glycosyltransferase involved in cell wall biosynthesis